MADREKAKRSRAEARQRRRKSTQEASEDKSTAGSPSDHAIDEFKQAAKVAAASAAVGAAVAAARNLASRDGEQEAQADEGRPEGVADEPEREPDRDLQQDVEPDRDLQQDLRPQAERSEESSEGLGSIEQAEESDDERADEPRKPLAGASPDEARETARQARDHLELLLGRAPESLSSLERTRDGWLVTLEVLEVARIPESTDVIASYEMDLDEDGNLRRYARVRRYRRSQADDGDGS